LKSRLHASSPRVIVGAIKFGEVESVGHVDVRFGEGAHNLSRRQGNGECAQMKLNNQQAKEPEV